MRSIICGVSATKDNDVNRQDRHHEREDALRRAAAFPVQGGDVLPIKRKSWYPHLNQEHRSPKRK